MTKTEILKSIRTKCLECMAGQVEEIRKCTCDPETHPQFGCALWPFRFGKDPAPSQARSKAGRVAAVRNFNLSMAPEGEIGTRIDVS